MTVPRLPTVSRRTDPISFARNVRISITAPFFSYRDLNWLSTLTVRLRLPVTVFLVNGHPRAFVEQRISIVSPGLISPTVTLVNRIRLRLPSRLML